MSIIKKNKVHIKTTGKDLICSKCKRIISYIGKDLGEEIICPYYFINMNRLEINDERILTNLL